MYSIYKNNYIKYISILLILTLVLSSCGKGGGNVVKREGTTDTVIGKPGETPSNVTPSGTERTDTGTITTGTTATADAAAKKKAVDLENTSPWTLEEEAHSGPITYPTSPLEEETSLWENMSSWEEETEKPGEIPLEVTPLRAETSGVTLLDTETSGVTLLDTETPSDEEKERLKKKVKVEKKDTSKEDGKEEKENTTFFGSIKKRWNSLWNKTPEEKKDKDNGKKWTKPFGHVNPSPASASKIETVVSKQSNVPNNDTNTANFGNSSTKNLVTSVPKLITEHPIITGAITIGTGIVAALVPPEYKATKMLEEHKKTLLGIEKEKDNKLRGPKEEYKRQKEENENRFKNDLKEIGTNNNFDDDKKRQETARAQEKRKIRADEIERDYAPIKKEAEDDCKKKKKEAGKKLDEKLRKFKEELNQRSKLTKWLQKVFLRNALINALENIGHGKVVDVVIGEQEQQTLLSDEQLEGLTFPNRLDEAYFKFED
jgi:hypothetical protein